MAVGSGEGAGWRIKPSQLIWKLGDRARQHRQAKTLTHTAALGRKGEDLAHRYLQKAGYSVIARNYRAGEDSEIDIVAAQKDGTIVFVEVKSRLSDEFGDPSRNVGIEKERHITRAARAYMTSAGLDWERVRFDVISIVFSDPPCITHNQDAFFARHFR